MELSVLDRAFSLCQAVLHWGERIRDAGTDDFTEFVRQVESYTHERGIAMRSAVEALRQAKADLDAFLADAGIPSVEKGQAHEKWLRIQDLRSQFVQQDASLRRFIQLQLKNKRESSATFNHNASVIRNYLK